MKAVGYIRVSSIDQAETGQSLEAQEQKIKDFCRAKGYVLLNIFRDEGRSGRKLNRPGLQAALDLVCRQTAVLVVYSLSRLSRSLIDCVQTFQKIERCGGGLVSITESQIDTTGAMGKLIFSVVSAFGEFESNIISERTRAVLRHKEMKGEKLGGPNPYGYVSSNGILIPDLLEQTVVGNMVARHSRGESPRRIANELNALEIKTRSGKKWVYSHVRKIIARDHRVRSAMERSKA